MNKRITNKTSAEKAQQYKRAERLNELSVKVGLAILVSLEAETDLDLREVLSVITCSLLRVLNALSDVSDEDPKKVLRSFIGALQEQEDLAERG